MILPNGKNKKYVEIISGLYVLYVILNPILNLDKSFANFDINDSINSLVYDGYISQEQIAKNYILGLENNLKLKIEEMGYEVDYIQFYITQDYNYIAKIEIKMKASSDYDKTIIEKIVLENFDISKNNIMIF